MESLSVVVLPDQEWQAVLDRYGNGRVPVRFRFEMLSIDDPKLRGHVVVHGRNTQTGTMTSTGFLRNPNGQIVAGVDGIPISL